MKPSSPSGPLVILGIDAGDPEFLCRWAEQGHLPTIASIMKRGCWGKTGGPELISEHGVWVSLLSGISRCDTGYYYFRQQQPGTYDLQEVGGADVDASPFWAHLAGRDKVIVVIDPPDMKIVPGIPGAQLLHWDTHDGWNPDYYLPAAEPPELLSEIVRTFGPKLPVIEVLESDFDQDLQLYRRLLSHVEKKGSVSRHLLARDRLDLVVIVFAASHAASHQFWRYAARTSHDRGPREETSLTHAIRGIYQAIDSEIGQTLAQLPESSNVVLLSSVGMADDYPTTGLTEAFCRQLGYQATPQGREFSLRPLEIARRLMPEPWRIALSGYLSRARREHLLADQFRRGTDWARTTAFALPSAYTSFLRVNLRGREPQGIVEAGTEYRELLDRIESDLRQLTDPETSEPAVTRIDKTVELFGCEAHPVLPDVFVDWKPGRFMKRIVHPNAVLTQNRPSFFRRSDHSAQGFFAAAGPSIQQLGPLAAIDPLDLAPTFLHLLGTDAPDHLRGSVRADLLRD